MIEITKGSELVLKVRLHRETLSYSNANFEAGTVVEVTAGPFKDGSFRVRGLGTTYTSTSPQSFKVRADEVEDIFETDPNAPRPRQLGEVPEGMISPEDPRLAWLWEDAEKVANREDYCAEYDKLCAKLSIPGREREFTVKHQIGELTASFKVKARSHKQAEAKVLDSLKN